MWRIGRSLGNLALKRSFGTRLRQKLRVNDGLNTLKSSVQEFSDEVLQNEKLGLVVNHLPKVNDEAQLKQQLAQLFKADKDKIQVYNNILNQPAYALVMLNKESDIQNALKLSKQKLLDSKIYVKTLSDFLNSNYPTLDGTDSRRVIIYDLEPTLSREVLQKHLMRYGQVLDLHYPKDYDVNALMPFNLPPPDFTHFQFLKRIETSSGNVQFNYLQLARQQILSLINECINRFDLNLNNKELSKIFAELYKVWMLTRSLKDWLHIKPCEKEQEINEMINSIKEQKDKGLVIQQLIENIQDHSLGIIDDYFPHRGYAYVTYSKRQEAERLIAEGHFFIWGETKFITAFDKNIPPWFYHKRLLNEAFTLNVKNLRGPNKRFTKARANITLQFDMNRLTHLLKQSYQGKKFYYGSDDMEDPVISGKLFNYQQDKFIRQQYVKPYDRLFGDRALKYFSKKDPESSIWKFSSDEEFYDPYSSKSAKLDSIQGRLKRKEDLKTYFGQQYSQIIQDRNDEFEESWHSMTSFPIDFNPPKTQQSDAVEDRKNAKRLEQVQKYFFEPLPDSALQQGNLKKKKYGDFPENRFVYKLPFDYNVSPNENPKETDQYDQMMRDLHNLQQKLNLSQEDDPVFGIQGDFRYGEEEKAIVLDKDRYYALTDSDDQAELQAFQSSDMVRLYKREEQQRKMKNMSKKDFQFQELKIMTNSDKEVARFDIYKGNDIEGHIQELKAKYPELQYEWFKDSDNDIVIKSSITRNPQYNLETFEILESKYNISQVMDPSELQVDEEDLELLQDYVSWPRYSIDVLNELYRQQLHRKLRDKEMLNDTLDNILAWGDEYQFRKTRFEQPEQDYF